MTKSRAVTLVAGLAIMGMAMPAGAQQPAAMSRQHMEQHTTQMQDMTRRMNDMSQRTQQLQQQMGGMQGMPMSGGRQAMHKCPITWPP